MGTHQQWIQPNLISHLWMFLTASCPKAAIIIETASIEGNRGLAERNHNETIEHIKE